MGYVRAKITGRDDLCGLDLGDISSTVGFMDGFIHFKSSQEDDSSQLHKL